MPDPVPCCDSSFPHEEHARCYSCGKRVAVSRAALAIVNSTLCAACREGHTVSSRLFLGIYRPPEK